MLSIDPFTWNKCSFIVHSLFGYLYKIVNVACHAAKCELSICHLSIVIKYLPHGFDSL